jgi:hypothetical protein
VSHRAFADALDVLSENPDLSLAGIFTPSATGEHRATRLIIFREDVKIATFTTGVRSPGYRVMLRQADVPERPIAGDTLEVIEGRFAGSYQVRDVHEDGLRLSWDLELGQAA